MNYFKYFKNYNKSIYNLLDQIDPQLIRQSYNLIQKTSKMSNKVYIAGNGGSASIATHVSVDFSKIAKIPVSTFNEPNLITCYANDFGYENWLLEAVKVYCNKSDLLILISSSGKSKNIINAAKYCVKNSINIITLTGFTKNNNLSRYGNINFHINSDKYNLIEMSHHIILVSIIDLFSNS